jgi:hypothetical protein
MNGTHWAAQALRRPALSAVRCSPPARAAAVASLLLAIAMPVQAQGGGRSEEPAAECCRSLQVPFGARAVALGQAIVAHSGVDALFVNPAAIAGLRENQFLVHTSETFPYRVTTFSLVANSALLGSFAVSYQLADAGEQQATDIFDIVTGAVSILEHVLSATYATPVADGLRGGLSYKLYQFRQDCRGYCGGEPSFAATTHAIDLGLQFRPRFLPDLSMGASLLHLGFPLQVINAEQASPLPTRLRLGAAYEILRHVRADSSITLVGSVEMTRPLRPDEASTIYHVGAELGWEGLVFVRAGYSTADGVLGGAAIGLGVRYERFDLAVARSFASSLHGEPFQVSFGIRF